MDEKIELMKAVADMQNALHGLCMDSRLHITVSLPVFHTSMKNSVLVFPQPIDPCVWNSIQVH